MIGRASGAGLVVAPLLAITSVPGVAAADEPYLADEPRVMREPGEVVHVNTAFERNLPVEVSFTLGFLETVRWVSIDHVGTTGKVLDTLLYRGSSSGLFPRVDVGLFHDLALYLAMPITLSTTYSLTSATNAASAPGPDGADLFALPFRSPDRSGPEHVAVGLETDVLNQAKKPALPTWMAGLEVRMPIGVSLHACNDKAPMGQVACAAPGDVDRNGKSDPGEPANLAPLTPGAGRGTVGVELHTFVSRRIHFVELYGGLRGVVEIPVGHSDFADVRAAGGGLPPVVLEGSIGTHFYPWENRERWSRVTVDMRVSAAAHTEGPDVTELYDALGSSAATSLRGPMGSAIPFSGLTRVAPYPSGRIATEAIWQSSRYIKLSVVVRGGYEGNHTLTLADPTLSAWRPAAAGFDSRARFSLDVGAKAVVTF